MSWDVQKINSEITSLPDSWEGFSRVQKVQLLLDVIEEQLKQVRNGMFDVSKGERVAALILECQMVLAEFYTDIEANARNAKHFVEFAEADKANSLAKNSDKKVGEAALKRLALTTDDVRNAKEKLVEYERDFKKWKCVYEILREAHIMFRNIAKL